ncbi:hypothetical protein [Streptomyces chattanoogensis]|nr:hypothetical protein [Streptomyces chattanoogensis]
MTSTPFRDTVRNLARTKDYILMQVECDKARSHSWWRNVVEHGAWKGPGTIRVGPPTPDELPGIAKLFGTSEAQVQAMIAADWYGIEPSGGLSPRVMNMAPLLDKLEDEQADALGVIIRAMLRDGQG